MQDLEIELLMEHTCSGTGGPGYCQVEGSWMDHTYSARSPGSLTLSLSWKSLYSRHAPLQWTGGAGSACSLGHHSLSELQESEVIPVLPHTVSPSTLWTPRKEVTAETNRKSLKVQLSEVFCQGKVGKVRSEAQCEGKHCTKSLSLLKVSLGLQDFPAGLGIMSWYFPLPSIYMCTQLPLEYYRSEPQGMVRPRELLLFPAKGIRVLKSWTLWNREGGRQRKHSLTPIFCQLNPHQIFACIKRGGLRVSSDLRCKKDKD